MSLTTLTMVALFLLAMTGVSAGWLGGAGAVAPAVVCGAMAAGTQLGAARLARRRFDAAFTEFLGAWAMGIGLRFVGVVLLALAMLAAPEQFPPLPSAFGFLGVLIPLLLLEMRLTR
jgi:hypothetical protein